MTKIRYAFNGLMMRIDTRRSIKELVNFEPRETFENGSINAALMPFTPEEMRLLDANQQNITWVSAYVRENEAVLKIEDLINYGGVWFRVQKIENFSLYGYRKYGCCEDSSGN